MAPVECFPMRRASFVVLLRSLVVLTLLALTAGCSLLSGNVGVLWTNRPEFTTYAELFNASQSRYKLEVVYKADPVLSLANATKVPDLVVGLREDSIPIIGRFVSLDQILNRGEVNPSLFYRDLLRTGRYEGRQLLLPVSFDLPALLSEDSTAAPPVGAMTVTLDQVKQRALVFDKNTTDAFRVLAFSPRWSGDFLYLAAQMMGADFRQDSHGDLAWDDQKLSNSVSYLRDWIDNVDGGNESDLEFGEKYLYDPVDKLLSSGRVAFYYMSLSGFYDLSADKRKTIRLQWVAQNGRVPVLDTLLFAGVPRWARNRAAAFAFLQWFYRPVTQRRLLEASRDEHLKVFGIANGLSALPQVNEHDFPQSYPFLISRIPQVDSLAFPKPLPADWEGIKSDVLVPWLNHEILSPATDQPLRERLKAWRLQRPLM